MGSGAGGAGGTEPGTVPPVFTPWMALATAFAESASERLPDVLEAKAEESAADIPDSPGGGTTGGTRTMGAVIQTAVATEERAPQKAVTPDWIAAAAPPSEDKPDMADCIAESADA